MKDEESINIRLLEEGDPPRIAAEFRNLGWNKPEDRSVGLTVWHDHLCCRVSTTKQAGLVPKRGYRVQLAEMPESSACPESQSILEEEIYAWSLYWTLILDSNTPAPNRPN